MASYVDSNLLAGETVLYRGHISKWSLAPLILLGVVLLVFVVGLVFLLWGRPAQEKGATIDPARHHVLKAAHPSPFSADRGFFGCRHFSKANALLAKSGRSPIDWRL